MHSLYGIVWWYEADIARVVESVIQTTFLCSHLRSMPSGRSRDQASRGGASGWARLKCTVSLPIWIARLKAKTLKFACRADHSYNSGSLCYATLQVYHTRHAELQKTVIGDDSQYFSSSLCNSLMPLRHVYKYIYIWYCPNVNLNLTFFFLWRSSRAEKKMLL